MLVKVQVDSMGNVHIVPVAVGIRTQIREHLAKFGIGGQVGVFLQEGMGAAEFVDEFVPNRCVKELDHGWPVKIRINADVFENMVGYDFRILAKNRERLRNRG